MLKDALEDRFANFDDDANSTRLEKTGSLKKMGSKKNTITVERKFQDSYTRTSRTT